MRSTRRRTLLVRCAAAAGLLPAGGCLSGIERNLDLLLSPGAVANALVLPYSPVRGLAELFAWLLSG